MSFFSSPKFLIHTYYSGPHIPVADPHTPAVADSVIPRIVVVVAEDEQTNLLMFLFTQQKLVDVSMLLQRNSKEAPVFATLVSNATILSSAASSLALSSRY